MERETVTSAPEILPQYQSIRRRTQDLCNPLSPEDYIPQPAVFVSPAKWHIAHTTWFFEEFVLSQFAPGYKRFNSTYAYLFNSYYNGVGERLNRDHRGLLTRPPLSEIWEFRAHVDFHIEKLLQETEDPQIERLIALGLQHEQQHQELLITDFKYILSCNPTYPVYQENFSLVDTVEPQYDPVPLSAGVYEIGFEGSGFSFDNEHGRHRTFVEDVAIDGNLVTNGAFQEFIAHGGYQKHHYWLDEGWQFIKEHQLQHPLYWKKISGQWHQYTLRGLIPVNPDAILCHINYYEAQAYALWRGKRLLTEFEWEAAASKLHWGNAWEWTQSAYLPYPKYTAPQGAVGEYNGKFMVNQMVLRGASKATAPGHSRISYRNFFHPQYQWQATGIRLAQDL